MKKYLLIYFFQTLLAFGVMLLAVFPVIFGVVFVLMDFMVANKIISWNGFLGEVFYIFRKLLFIPLLASGMLTFAELGRVKGWWE